ncbi:MAG: hypothetical protein ACRDNM_05150 [Gaiellaceae bacterium]
MTIRVPTGWHAAITKTPSCDPERLIAVSSAPLRIGRTTTLAPPPHGNVLILLLEDRYRQDRPTGDLQRPAHFSVAWNRPVTLKPICGMPNTPAFLRYFRAHGRYVGFIVYPAGPIGSRTRAATLAIMDSLRFRT